MKGIADEFEIKLNELLKKAAGWTVEQRDLGIKLAAEYAMLIAEGIAGEEVEDELPHVQAQILNLAATAERTGMQLFNEALEFAFSSARKLLGLSH